MATHCVAFFYLREVVMKFEDLPNDIQLVAANCLSRLIMERPYMEKEPMERLAQDIKNAFIGLYHQG